MDFRSSFDLFCKLVGANIHTLNTKIVAYLIDLSLFKNHDGVSVWNNRLNTLGYGCEDCVNGDPFKYFKIVLDDDVMHIPLIESWLGLKKPHNINIVSPFVACKDKYVLNLPIGFRNKTRNGYNEGVFDVIFDHERSHKCVVMDTTDNKKLLIMSVNDNSSMTLMDLCASIRYLQENIVPLLTNNLPKTRIHIFIRDFSIGEKFQTCSDISDVLDSWIMGKITNAKGIIDQTDHLVARTSLEVPAMPPITLPSDAPEVRFEKSTMIAVFGDDLKPEFMHLLSLN